MTAEKFIEANIKKSKQKNATVLALIDNGDYHGWWHVHRDEELPKPKYRPVIAFR